LGGTNAPAPGVPLRLAVGGEALATGLLALLCLAVADVPAVTAPGAPRRSGAIAPALLGGAVTVSHLLLLPIDGCGINPARTLGAAAVWAARGRGGGPSAGATIAIALAPLLGALVAVSA
jgi:glycerol uptake facilitator-like aquaporin